MVTCPMIKYFLVNEKYFFNNSYFCIMDEQAEHIELLKLIATAYRSDVVSTEKALVKLGARDVIDAGARLEQLGVFDFRNNTNDEVAKRIISLRDSVIDKYYRHFNSKNNVKIYKGGSRSGKTHNIIGSAIIKNQTEAYDLNIIAPSYKMLNLGSFIDAKEFIENNNIEAKVPANASGQIKFESGGIFTFEIVTSENEAKRNRKNVYFNEADGIKKEIASLVIGRAKGETHIDFNPTKRFWVDDYVTETNFLESSWLDNPFLSSNQLEWFKNLKKHGEFAEIGSPERYAYEVYYLGNYSNLAKSVFRGDDFNFWDDLPNDFDIVFSYADPSLGVGNDYFAAGLFGIKNGQDFLIDSVFSQYETAETYLKKMKQWDKMFKCEHFIETNGLGKSIFNKIKNNYNGIICSEPNHDNKNGDIILYSPEAKQILYNKTKATEEMIKQCVAFPDAKHNDAPDMLCRSRKIKEKYFAN